MSIAEFTDKIETFDGVDPVTGVECSLPAEAYAAYAHMNSLGVDADEFSEWRTEAEDSYQGFFTDDEDFAQEMADSPGLIDTDATWPANCINWEQAARELMMDYSEEAGYYFRD